MARIEKFEDLRVWQRCRVLNQKLFKMWSRPDFKADFKLRDQMNGSCGSAMDNIAEGFERDGSREFIQFLSISKASVGEFRSQLYRAFDRKYISEQEFKELVIEAHEIACMIGRLMRTTKTSEYTGTKSK